MPFCPPQCLANIVLMVTEAAPRQAALADRVPPASFFLVSAVFHYLGPSFAVLLFVNVDVLGVAWLRIASAAVVFAIWRRPWRVLQRASASQRRVLLGLGAVLAAMNSLFYLAIDRLPLSTVGAIEFLGTIVLATPFAVTAAAPAFTHPVWLLWAIGVGLCSSVIPYVTDQLAMARLPRATFALMLALLPATATVVGLVVLSQVPTARDLAGVGLVVVGVALHQEVSPDRPRPRRR